LLDVRRGQLVRLLVKAGGEAGVQTIGRQVVPYRSHAAQELRGDLRRRRGRPEREEVGVEQDRADVPWQGPDVARRRLEQRGPVGYQLGGDALVHGVVERALVEQGVSAVVPGGRETAP